MEYHITMALWFSLGLLFHKIFSGLLELGLVSSMIEKTTKDLLISLVFIEQDIQFIMESKKLMLKEKGASENDLEHYTLIHERNFRLWREKVIVTMINNYPSLYRNKFLPFNNWNGAAQYVNELIKLQRDVAKYK